jgi:hypothetical protein
MLVVADCRPTKVVLGGWAAVGGGGGLGGGAGLVVVAWATLSCTSSFRRSLSSGASRGGSSGGGGGGGGGGRLDPAGGGEGFGGGLGEGDGGDGGVGKVSVRGGGVFGKPQTYPRFVNRSRRSRAPSDGSLRPNCARCPPEPVNNNQRQLTPYARYVRMSGVVRSSHRTGPARIVLPPRAAACCTRGVHTGGATYRLSSSRRPGERTAEAASHHELPTMRVCVPSATRRSQR